MLAFLLMSCVVQPDDSGADEFPVEQEDQFGEHVAACLPGITVHYDIGVEPYALSVELRYMMDVYIEAPFVRTGTVIEVQCGQHDDAANGEPQVDGEWAGPIIGYRASWLSPA